MKTPYLESLGIYRCPISALWSPARRFARRLLTLLSITAAPLCPAFTPDGSVPTSLDDLMPSSWDLSTVTNQIWVAPGGTGDGSSESSPLGTIQEAIYDASPGTVILVKAGTYTGTVTMRNNYDSLTGIDATVDGTDTAPILLVSADGIGEAILQSPNNMTTVRGIRRRNWGVIGFEIVGSGPSGSGDESPVKIGADDITSGDKCENWFFAGNLITGQGRDGTKAYSSRNIFWIGNTYDGTWGQEACDNVIVGVMDTEGDDNQFAFNTVGGFAEHTAITMKYGTNNYLIYNNAFTLETDTHAILVGGHGPLLNYIDEIPYQTEPDFDPQTCVKTRILYNKFTADVNNDVLLLGSRACEVRYNDMSSSNSFRDISDAIHDMGSDGNGGTFLFTPADNIVTDNKIVSSTENDFRGGLDDGTNYTITGNSSSVTFNYPVGASQVAPLIEALIDTLRSGPSTDIIIVENGDFENGDDGSWDDTGSSIQSTVTHNGSAYAGAVTPNGSYRKIIQEDIPVLAGETLSADGYLRIVGFDGVKKGLYQLRFYDTDAGGTYSGSTSSPYYIGSHSVAGVTSTVNNDWEYFSSSGIVVPDDADTLTVWLAAQPSSTGTLYFDDIGVYASDDIPGAQLLADGDFANSNGNGDWSVHATADIASTAGIGGSPALHQPAGSSYTATSQVVDTTGITALNAAGYIKADNLASGKRAILQVRFFNSSDSKIGEESVGDILEDSGGLFVQFVATNIVVPSGTAYAKFWCAVNGGGQGEAWFDDLQLTEAP